MREFVDLGFNATVVKVNTKVLGEEWLGRELNNQFYDDITKLKNVDPCGEGGEYHTCITDGPLFRETNQKFLNPKKLCTEILASSQ